MVFAARRVFGQDASGDIPAASIEIKNPLGFDTLEGVVGGIVGILNNFAIPIFTVMILFGGFQLMTAGGDPERVKKGRNTVWYAVIGYAVIFLANAIIFILKDILKVTS